MTRDTMAGYQEVVGIPIRNNKLDYQDGILNQDGSPRSDNKSRYKDAIRIP